MELIRLLRSFYTLPLPLSRRLSDTICSVRGWNMGGVENFFVFPWNNYFCPATLLLGCIPESSSIKLGCSLKIIPSLATCDATFQKYFFSTLLSVIQWWSHKWKGSGMKWMKIETINFTTLEISIVGHSVDSCTASSTAGTAWFVR